MKRFNPYTALKNVAKEFADAVDKYRILGTVAFHISKPDLVQRTPYRLDDIYQRGLAAQQLGYDMSIVCDETTGMTIYYKKRLPQIPYELR